ncbi:GlsB/YeaQ/YmgE family stress response membrane protein [Haliscomenobacter sp.]|uniref:GlsB/YeaQ/YmgE family stress response membrane protein n=1 Tax=Haliscomenobacter sp. TaxID=2717303 RepID=UPI00359433F9
MDIIYILIIGAVSGWLAGQIMKGGGFGLLWNIILGIVGSFVGGWLFGVLNISLNVGSATVNTIIQSVIGAIVLLFVAGLLRGGRGR